MLQSAGAPPPFAGPAALARATRASLRLGPHSTLPLADTWMIALLARPPGVPGPRLLVLGANEGRVDAGTLTVIGAPVEWDGRYVGVLAYGEGHFDPLWAGSDQGYAGALRLGTPVIGDAGLPPATCWPDMGPLGLLLRGLQIRPAGFVAFSRRVPAPTEDSALDDQALRWWLQRMTTGHGRRSDLAAWAYHGVLRCLLPGGLLDLEAHAADGPPLRWHYCARLLDTVLLDLPSDPEQDIHLVAFDQGGCAAFALPRSHPALPALCHCAGAPLYGAGRAGGA